MNGPMLSAETTERSVISRLASSDSVFLQVPLSSVIIFLKGNKKLHKEKRRRREFSVIN